MGIWQSYYPEPHPTTPSCISPPQNPRSVNSLPEHLLCAGPCSAGEARAAEGVVSAQSISVHSGSGVSAQHERVRT